MSLDEFLLLDYELSGHQIPLKEMVCWILLKCGEGHSLKAAIGSWHSAEASSRNQTQDPSAALRMQST